MKTFKGIMGIFRDLAICAWACFAINEGVEVEG